MTTETDDLMKKLVSLCKRRGFVFQSGEVYGGLQSAWDYGPLGVELKRNIETSWWNFMVSTRTDVVGMDSAIITHPDVWMASGHLKHFHDPLVDCLKCKGRFRQDQVEGNVCPDCGGELTEPRDFGLMFRTSMGALEGESATVYLRPETCQPIFVNFRNVVTATRQKLPFGIAQMGKAFRNEITARNFIFRSREFEQMEMEFFCTPEEADRWFEYWLEQRLEWYARLGITDGNLRTRRHEEGELAHYASGCVDIEYRFPFAPGGWGELEGIANRTDYDLKAHMEMSGQDLSFQDQVSNEKIIPFVIETSGGIGRTMLAVLLDAYREEIVEGRERVVLGLHRELAPIKVAVLPLSRKLDDPAEEVFRMVSPHLPSVFDVTGSIGKRYRRMDEAGTPFCVTFDFDSLEDSMVTVRERDSLGQIRTPIDTLVNTLNEIMAEGWPEG
ncbi:MAG: glycine--tRNA ligase [Candidatus Aegiribacteria sp. MLS_C]|nr:MAG: glycine--tRNA ligase [Candidatus Aegiribacteria sp. MLS_C]